MTHVTSLKRVDSNMHRVNGTRAVWSAGLTLSVGGVSRVNVEGLLALSDGGRQREVGLHHPLLVVAVDDRFGGHSQGVTLGDVLSQSG